jgi:hypothetical protein
MMVSIGILLVPKEQIYATDPKNWPKGTDPEKILKEGTEK